MENQHGAPVWWGYIADIRLQAGQYTFSLNLDAMYNKIRISYSTPDGLTTGMTDYAEDEVSIAEFGTRELVDSLPSSTLLQAVNYRDTLLAAYGTPGVSWNPGSGNTVSAQITCQGWWSTLDWAYYEADAAGVANDITATNGQQFGWTYGDADSTDTLGFYYNLGVRRIYNFGWTSNVTELNESGWRDVQTSNTLNVYAPSAPAASATYTVQSLSLGATDETLQNIYFVPTPGDPYGAGKICGPSAYAIYNLFQSHMIQVSGTGSNNRYFTTSGGVQAEYNPGSGMLYGVYVNPAPATESDVDNVRIRTAPYLKVTGGAYSSSIYPTDVDIAILYGPDYISQSFEFSAISSLTVKRIQLRLKRHPSTPAGRVWIYLKNMSGGNPGSTILGQSEDVDTDDVSATEFAWVEFEFTTPVVLSASTSYCIQVHRDQTASTINEGQIWLGGAVSGYADGAIRQRQLASGTGISTWSGSSWITDAAFRIYGAGETSEVAQVIIDYSGQFLTNVVIADPSNLAANEARGGTQTALQEVESLLNQGTSDLVPLYAEVLEDRSVRIYKQPDQPTRDQMLRLHKDGVLTYANGSPYDVSSCPVAVWVALTGVVPPEVDLPLLADPSVAFIEEAEYDVENNVWRPQPRGSDSPWAISGLKRG
jgi:hypothetical protein